METYHRLLDKLKYNRQGFPGSASVYGTEAYWVVYWGLYDHLEPWQRLMGEAISSAASRY